VLHTVPLSSFDSKQVEGDRGWEVYGRWEKRGQEAGFPR